MWVQCCRRFTSCCTFTPYALSILWSYRLLLHFIRCSSVWSHRGIWFSLPSPSVLSLLFVTNFVFSIDALSPVVPAILSRRLIWMDSSFQCSTRFWYVTNQMQILKGSSSGCSNTKPRYCILFRNIRTSQIQMLYHPSLNNLYSPMGHYPEAPSKEAYLRSDLFPG